MIQDVCKGLGNEKGCLKLRNFSQRFVEMENKDLVNTQRNVYKFIVLITTYLFLFSHIYEV